MKIYSEPGKLPNAELENLVLSKIEEKREEVLVGSSVGEDTAVLDLGGDLAVLSSDPITGAVENLGKLAIHVSVNDVSTKSADAVGVLLTLLLPLGTKDSDIEKIMNDARSACDEVHMDIIGGHTEITDTVNQPIMISTVIGRVREEDLPEPDRIEAGDLVCMSKYAGLEGTAILCHDRADALHILGSDLIRRGAELVDDLSVQTEGEVAAHFRIGYMHDITEGGVEGALWESAVAVGKGMEIQKSKIPVHPATRAIEESTDINIYRLISSGSMIVIMNPDDFEPMHDELLQRGIPFTQIGVITDKEGIVYTDQGDRTPIDPPGADALYSALAELQ